MCITVCKIVVAIKAFATAEVYLGEHVFYALADVCAYTCVLMYASRCVKRAL